MRRDGDRGHVMLTESVSAADTGAIQMDVGATNPQAGRYVLARDKH